MLKVGSKRRRSKKQIAEEKEQAIRQEAATHQQLQELAALRAQVNHLQQEAVNGKAAASLISQMINAGHVQQDSESTIVLNVADGQVHRFGADGPEQIHAAQNDVAGNQ